MIFINILIFQINNTPCSVSEMSTNQMKTCLICLNTIGRDHLKTHMKRHIRKIEEVDDKDIHEISVKYSSSNFEKLEKYVLCQMEKFESKIVLGRKLNIIIEKHDLNTHALSQNMKDALKVYELYGKKMDMEEINWKGWQKDLRLYMNYVSCNMKVIWVVGARGNEGKSFFQWNILEELGYSKVSALQLGKQSRNTFHILGKLYSTNNDIFLFNVERGEYLSTNQYKLFESIKDGTAMNGDQVLNLKKPNIFIVFANREPDREKLSEDRWIILKILEDLTHLKEITDDSCMIKKRGRK